MQDGFKVFNSYFDALAFCKENEITDLNGNFKGNIIGIDENFAIIKRETNNKFVVMKQRFFVDGNSSEKIVAIVTYDQKVFLQDTEYKQEILDLTVYGIIAELFEIDINRIKPEAELVDDLGADSLALFELIFACEDIFNIDVDKLDEERLAFVSTVDDFCAELFKIITAQNQNQS
jgi:acyl carrier protein